MPETWSVPPRVLADAVDLRELVRLGQVNDALAGKAAAGHAHDNTYVDFASDQSIGGIKEFTTSGGPLVPAPTVAGNPTRWGDRAPAGGTSSSTLSVTQTYTIDAAGAPVRYFTLTASPTLAVPTNGVNGQVMRFWLLASGAARTFTFASGYELSPLVPSRVISIASGTWEMIEVECRNGTWRLVGTDQVLVDPIDTSARTALFGSPTRTQKPDCRAILAASSALSASVNTQLASWTVGTNPDGALTSGGVFTVPTLSATMRWRVQLHARFNPVASAYRLLYINRDSTSITAASILAFASLPTSGGTSAAMANGDIFDCVYEGPLTAGAALRFFAYSTVASSVTAASVFSGETYLSITLLGPA